MGGFSVKAASLEGIALMSDLGDLIGRIITYILGFAGIVLFVLLIIGGFKYMTSGGDPKSVESAQKTLTSAVAGLLIMIFSYIILVLISRITGVDLTTFSISIPS